MPTIVAMDEGERKRRFAFALDAAMAVREINDDELARLVNRSMTTVGRWRRADTSPNRLDAEALGEALGVSADYFLSPPPLPTYPVDEYLVGQAAVMGLELGVKNRPPVSRHRAGREDRKEQ